MTIEAWWIISGTCPQPGRELAGGLEFDLVQELKEWQAEAIGWLPLGESAYLHVGKPEEEELVITVVGVPEAGMAGMNLLLVG